MMIRSIAAALALFLAAPAIAQDAAPAEQGQVEILPDITMGAEDAPLTIFE
ncbi:MAG TPA: DsbA family protein, partial [Paracoccus sp.]|nr:DsbA family protein [Paracoccus sp. (in: a-proteobacteria)]